MSDRRLIEDSLPLAEISEQSAREKYIRKGHISTLHLWWARRPLAACRAAVYAAMVDAPKTTEERQRQHELLKKIVDWDVLEPSHPDHGLLRVAADNITKSHAARLSRRKGKDATDTHERPRVLDPFTGGGAIPLEAQRLGCETFGNDLNPVAHVIELGSIYYPQRFAEDVVRPMKDGDLPNVDVPAEPRLAVEVERWANWVQQRVAGEVGSLYPSSGPEREVLGYFWVRQVHCSNPACRVLIPVVNQTWLANKPKDYLARTMSIEVLRGISANDIAAFRGRQEPGTPAPTLPDTNVLGLRPTRGEVVWSTLQVRRFEWNQSPRNLTALEGETDPSLHILVGCQRRFPHGEAVEQWYGLAVRLWHEDATVDLHQELRSRIRPRATQRARIKQRG